MAHGAAIDRLLDQCRQGMERVAPGALEAELPGAVVVDRNVLEWRLDSSSPYRIPEAEPGRKVIVVCNEGYSSSLAAHTLRLLGIADATDLEGGFQAWAACRAR